MHESEPTSPDVPLGGRRHVSRMGVSHMRCTLAAVALVLLLPSSAAAQAWWEPYQRGEYDKALEILHTAWLKAVADPKSKALFNDFDVPEMLGRIYLDGRGVPPDAVLGCSFYEVAAANVRMRPFVDPDPEKIRVMRARDAACDSLTEAGRAAATELIGCPKYGGAVETLALGDGRSVHLDRLSIRLEERRHEHVFPLSLPCNSRLAQARVVHSALPSNAGKGIFVDVFYWIGARKSAHRALEWRRYEVLTHTVEVVDGKPLGQQPGNLWVEAEVPAGWLEKVPSGREGQNGRQNQQERNDEQDDLDRCAGRIAGHDL